MEKTVLEILRMLHPIIHTIPFWPGHLAPREEQLNRIEEMITDLEELIQHQSGNVEELPPTTSNPLIFAKGTENV